MRKCKKYFPCLPDFEECYSCDEGVYEDSDDYVGCPFCESGKKEAGKLLKQNFVKLVKKKLDYEYDDEW